MAMLLTRVLLGKPLWSAARRPVILIWSYTRCTVCAFSSSVDCHSSGLERYKDLQKTFIRRLRELYHRFSDSTHHAVVCSRHYVYFVEGDGLYRMDTRHNKPDPEVVLYLGQCSSGTEGTREEKWSIQRVRLSPQEKHLAVTLKTPHREEPRCVVVKLGEEPSPVLDPSQNIITLDKVFSFEWATDEVLFYTSQEGLRCSRVFRLDLTSSGTSTSLVYEDTQPHVFVEVGLSRDRRLITINSNSKSSSEVWLIDANTPTLEALLVQPRLPELLYHVEHWRGWLLILASTGPGHEYQVVKAPLSTPSMGSWELVYAPDPHAFIKDMEVIGDQCVLTIRQSTGQLTLAVVTLLQPKQPYTIQLPSWACAIDTKPPPGLTDHHSVLEVLLSSPVCPPVPYRLYPSDGLLLSATGEDDASSENHRRGSYSTTRLEAHSQDGTMVPITVFHTVPLECLRGAPLLVHVYGSYGRELSMDFSPEARLLLEQGWVLAYCHVRGGGERGLSWHRQARVEGKQRGVEDLLACLRHLSSLGVSSPSLTALTARSAGAVPVGALCNTHPHLLGAITLQAPFLDVLGTMADPQLPLTVEEREEWGDPLADPEHRLTIASYCPCHNITPQYYPSMLLTAYSGDVRIPLVGVLKYAERLKKAIHVYSQLHTRPASERVPNVVLNILPGADHFGPEDFDLVLKESALQMAFFYTELGLEPPHHPRKKKRRR